MKEPLSFDDSSSYLPILPRNVRALDSHFIRQPLGGFADNLELADDTVLNQVLFLECFFVDAIQILFDPGNGIQDVLEIDRVIALHR